MGPNRREAWRCQFCRTGENQPVNVAENPSSSSSTSTGKPLTPIAQANKRALREVTTDPVAIINAGDNNTPVLAEIKKLRAEIKEIATSCEFFGNKYDELNANIIKNNKFMELITKEISELKEINTQKDETIKKMQVQINILEQQVLKKQHRNKKRPYNK